MEDFSSLFIFFPAEVLVCRLPISKNLLRSTPRSHDIRGYFRKTNSSPTQVWSRSLSLTQPHSSPPSKVKAGYWVPNLEVKWEFEKEGIVFSSNFPQKK